MRAMNVELHGELNRLGVPHVFEEYEGDHGESGRFPLSEQCYELLLTAAEVRMIRAGVCRSEAEQTVCGTGESPLSIESTERFSDRNN